MVFILQTQAILTKHKPALFLLSYFFPSIKVNCLKVDNSFCFRILLDQLSQPYMSFEKHGNCTLDQFFKCLIMSHGLFVTYIIKLNKMYLSLV